MTITTEAAADMQPEVFCPIRQTIKILGKRWTILIIKELYYGKKKTLGFMDLKKKLGNISAKVLSQRLTEMIDENLIKKRVHAKKTPVRVYYSLTEKGSDACDIIEGLKAYGLKWGGKYVNDCKDIDCELCEKIRIEEKRSVLSRGAL